MPHTRPKDKIPFYSADNELRDWITPKRAERLEAAGIARVVRHKKGHVNRCIMHRRPGDPQPTPLSVYLGTRYSYLERLDSGRLVWALRKLRVDEGVPVALLQLITECSVERVLPSVSAQRRAQLAQVAPRK